MQPRNDKNRLSERDRSRGRRATVPAGSSSQAGRGLGEGRQGLQPRRRGTLGNGGISNRIEVRRMMEEAILVPSRAVIGQAGESYDSKCGGWADSAITD